MDYRRLQHFVALAQELHFSRGAQKVHLTQPAFSRSIQALERELGATLVNRHMGIVSLTPVGQLVLARAKELILDINSLKREVGFVLGCDTGSVAIGAGPFPAVTLVPAAIAQLVSEHAQMSVDVKVNNWALLLQHLFDEEIEFVVADVRDIPRDSRIAIKPLVRQMIAFAARADHPLFAGPRLRPRSVLAFPFAAPRIPQGFLAGLRQVLKARDDTLPTIVCDNPSLLVEVALNSKAVIMSTYAAIQAELASGALKEIRLPGQSILFVEMSIVTLVKRELSPGAKWLRDSIVERSVMLSKSNPGWWKRY